MTTRRPERAISSASCTPLAEAPSTSTPPAASWAGDRYVSGVSCSTDAGTPSELPGTCATLQAPLASTTLAASQAPWSVVTVYPSADDATRVTVVWVRTGASMV